MGKVQIFFDIQLQYHLNCKMVLQLNGIKKKKNLILSNCFNQTIFLSSLIFSLSFLSLPSLFLIPSLSLSPLSSFSLSHRITKPTFLSESPSQIGAHTLSPCKSLVSWGLWFCGGWFLKWVLPWVLQIADVVVLLWVSRFGFVCVCFFW